MLMYGTGFLSKDNSVELVKCSVYSKRSLCSNTLSMNMQCFVLSTDQKNTLQKKARDGQDLLSISIPAPSHFRHIPLHDTYRCPIETEQILLALLRGLPQPMHPPRGWSRPTLDMLAPTQEESYQWYSS